MKVWFVTCLLLFVVVELFQWLKGFMLPLPVYLLAGALLSLASNYEQGLNIWLKKFSEQSLPTPPTPIQDGESVESSLLSIENHDSN